MKTETGITIYANDRWFFQGSEIVNDRVLAFFRSNLRLGEEGLFIHNSFQGQEEIGYFAEVSGFPIHAIHAVPRVDDVELSLDNGNSMTLPYDHILMIDPQTLAFYTPDGIPGRFSPTAMSLAGTALLEVDGRFFWDTTHGRIPVSEMSRADFFTAVSRKPA